MRDAHKPVEKWSTASAGSRLTLAWTEPVALERSLPELPPGEVGPLQALVFHESSGQARLELDLAQPVQSSLRRVGDSWVLRLEPAARDAPPAEPTAPGMPKASPALAVAKLSAPRPVSPPGTRMTRAARKESKPAALEVLLLDVTVNGQRLADVVRIEQSPGDMLLMPAEVWAEARLVPPAQARTQSDGSLAYALDAVPGVTYRIDRKNLTMEINAAVSAFLSSTVGRQLPVAVPPPRPQPGMVLNYDLSVAYSGSARPVTTGATMEAIAFNKFGNFVGSAVLRDDGASRTFERLDTFWRYDLPHRLETIVVGDTVGSGGGWSRPARYGGVRWARAFSMRPGFVTLPQLTLSGQAALPSTVDVLINNAQRMRQPVSPGPFELTNVPVVTGAGEINLVVRDLLGRETVVKQSYYASAALLARGLTDFSVEGGWLRSGYGQDSHYGDGFASATWRQGLTDRLTGEVRLELQAVRRAVGVELTGLLGNWGTGRMALATSAGHIHGASEHGQLVQLGFERSTPRGSAALQYEHASQGFARFGEAVGPAVRAQRPREQWLASVGTVLWGSLSGGASYVSQSRWDGDQIQLVGLSASLPLWQRASMNFSLNKQLSDDGAWRADVSLRLPLDNGVYTAIRVDRQNDGELTGAVSAARNAPAGPGFGWHVEAATQQSQLARGGLAYSTSQAEWALHLASDAHGQVAGRAGSRGTLGLLGGMGFASRPVGQGSFAVVDVEGIAGVPVKRSHQVVAITNSHGFAFVPGLLPWQKNQIEIDPADLPLNTETGQLVQNVTPYAGGGSVVKFAMRRTRQALVVLHQPDGNPVPVGSRVRLLPEGPEFTAGRRGEVWLTDLADEHQRLQVSWAGGGCQLELAVPNIDGVPARIGPLACERK